MNVRNFEGFKAYLSEYVFPFIDNLLKDYEHYNYLEYLRCGNIRAGGYHRLEVMFRKNYQGFFAKGFTAEEFGAQFKGCSISVNLLMSCFHDPKKLQIRAFDENSLELLMTEERVSAKNKKKLKQFFDKTTKNDTEIKDLLVEFYPKMEVLFDVCNNTLFKNFELSSVGIAIAHVNYRRRTGDTMDLSIWIK
ncbi:hypothetical protein SAMN05421740_102763 [Parapedobacter koreensis]|uniref:Uncharacterized protein n=1 Tax=Parapedobacter koreensis TaxID=332977 RepID=A0A1H7K2E3_9SPHI|nr:LPO_1073/Vpar_1526 family protein [Parapedobacter koreensis]SEK81101.1 hypothetical protein SAMN05421740_102763 [Parapedobacter koreensis]